MNELWSVDQQVTAAYKTGVYIGEIVELSSHKAAVKVLAVYKHPDQGDLHQPGDAGVSFFHQRRALAYREIALMPLQSISRFEGSVPDYYDSLLESVKSEKNALQEGMRTGILTSEYAERAYKELAELEKDYEVKQGSNK